MSAFNFDSSEDTYSIDDIVYDYNDGFEPLTKAAFTSGNDIILPDYASTLPEYERSVGRLQCLYSQSTDDADEILKPSFKSLTIENSRKSVHLFEPIAPKLNSKSSQKRLLVAPQAPTMLLNTNFYMPPSKTLQSIVFDIKELLRSTSGIDFEFADFDCCFYAVYVRGSTHCEFRFFVYEDSISSGHIIEAQRMQGDCFAFTSVYRLLREKLSDTESDMLNHSKMQNDDIPAHMPMHTPEIIDPISDEQIESMLRRVVDMTKDKYIESRLEACRILCDFGGDPKLRNSMRATGCLHALINLIIDNGNLLVRQHAILCLAELSEDITCQEEIANSSLGLLSILLQQAKHGPYYSAEMRRESTRILANLATNEKLLPSLVDQVGIPDLQCWCKGLEALKDQDDRLFAQAERFQTACLPIVNPL